MLCSAGDIACKGRQDFDSGSDGGFVIPVHSRIGHEMMMHFGSLVSWYERKTAHSSLHRRQHLQCLTEQRSEVRRNQYCGQFSAAGNEFCEHLILCRPETSVEEQRARKSNEDSEHRSAPIGDDIVPIGAPREDVEMGNDEDQEPLEAEVPRARLNPKNPTSREKQEHEDSGHAVCRSWCAACVEGRGVGGQHRIELLEEEERETERLP